MERQMKIAKGHCQGKEECRINPSQMFGVTCEGRKKMWIGWTCNGRDDVDNSTAVMEILPKAELAINKKCSPKGRLFTKDILVDGGWVNIKCTNECIYIKKILVHCSMKEGMKDKSLMERQMKIAKGHCQGKEECRITPSQMFGVTCEGRKKMWIGWTCNGRDDVDNSTAVMEILPKAELAVNFSKYLQHFIFLINSWQSCLQRCRRAHRNI